MRPTILASALLALAAGAAAKESAILTIVESTDIHSNIWSYDYFGVSGESPQSFSIVSY